MFCLGDWTFTPRKLYEGVREKLCGLIKNIMLSSQNYKVYEYIIELIIYSALL